MFDAILTAIRALGSFSTDEEADFCAQIVTREVKKGDSILAIGDVCKTLCFVESGSFVQYYKDDELNKIVVNLFNKDDWAINHASFTGQKASLHTIEAFEDGVIHALDIHRLHDLIGRSPSFFALGKILEEVHDFKDPKLSPDQKYALLLERRAAIIHTFPLKYISSYLGMTPETLSRVRSRIS